MAASNGAYTISERYHSEPRKLRVIHVGAGAAGLLFAYKAPKFLKNFELVCYEKNPHVAGTWFENRYPGCACDVPAHVYTYSFEPNPNWSSFYAFAPEIRAYFEGFADKYGLKQFIKLNSRVTSAKWSEEEGIYHVEVESDGHLIKDWCNILVNGTGFLNNWKWPEIAGIHDFSGHLMHSASYDTSVELQGKRVGVIGTGSSAIQIVPQVQKVAKHMTCFMRSVTWISPPVSGDVLAANKLESDLEGSKIPENAQYYYSAAEKEAFANNPRDHLQYRLKLEQSMNGLFRLFVRDSKLSIDAERSMRAEMIRRIGPGHEELKERLIPSWPPGCRRITPGDGYLEALTQPNVTTVHKEITKVVPNGVVDESGTLHELDVLICATGFNIAFNPPFQLLGIDGVSMKDEFTPEPKVYLALTVPKFPNYFIVNGPRGNWGSGSSLPSHEVQVEYILKCAKRMQEERIRSIEVKLESVLSLYEHEEAWHRLSVWDADCKSWYKNNEIGGKIWVWGGSALHYIKTIKEVKYEHYDFRYMDHNPWAYLGNGFIKAEVQNIKEDLAPYTRNSDTPWTI